MIIRMTMAAMLAIAPAPACHAADALSTALAITKSSIMLSPPRPGPQSLGPDSGALLRYCVVVANPGASTAVSIAASDVLPSNLTYLGGTIRSGATCRDAAEIEDDDASGADESDPVGASTDGATLTFTGARLAPGARLAFVLDARVN